MKKLLFLLVISFTIQNYSYAKLIEFEKCYNGKYILNSKETDIEKPENLKWSEEYYKVIETHLYHPFDPQKYDKIIKFRDQTAKLGENNNFSIYFYSYQIGSKINKDHLKQVKELEKQGFYKVNPTRELFFSIDTKNEIITRTIIFSADEMRAQDHAQSWYDLQRQKKGQPVFNWDKEKIKNLKYKINNFSGGIIQATEINSILEPQKITINIKNGLVTLMTNMKSIQNTEYLICKSLSGSSKKNDYTQYWWALILVAAVIFFIYTQTGRELKIRK